MHSDGGRGTQIRDKDGERSEECGGRKRHELVDKHKNFATDKVVLARGDVERSRPAYLRLQG